MIKLKNSALFSELKFRHEEEGLVPGLDLANLFWDHLIVFRAWSVHLTALEQVYSFPFAATFSCLLFISNNVHRKDKLIYEGVSLGCHSTNLFPIFSVLLCYFLYLPI